MSDITFDFACRDDCLERLVPSDLRKLVAERDALRQQLERVEAQADACQLQAQIWKQEARAQSSTVAEIYQELTGKTGEPGEPGDWNGVRPLKSAILRKQAEALEVEAQSWREDGKTNQVADDIIESANRLRQRASDLENSS